jgi:hypothetical protein
MVEQWFPKCAIPPLLKKNFLEGSIYSSQNLVLCPLYEDLKRLEPPLTPNPNGGTTPFVTCPYPFRG